MIRTAVGIALLILIAIYGLMYIKRESFTSTINFVNVIDAFAQMSDEEKTMIFTKGRQISDSLDKSLLEKIQKTEITSSDAKLIVETINNSINKEFAELINKYKLSSVDIISLFIYALNAGARQDNSINITPIELKNAQTLATFVKTWDPNAPVGKGLNAPSVAFTPPPTFAAVNASLPPSKAALMASTASKAPLTASATSGSSASLFSGSIPTLNESVRGAVRDELLAAGLLKKPYTGRDAYPPGTSFAYDGGLQQKWKQNAACNARDWCCRCRRPRNHCQCEHF